MTPTNTYHPDHIPPPGDSLLDILAETVGLDPGMVARLIIEHGPLTENDAYQLEQALGTPRTFWLARERRYRDHLQKGHTA